MFLANPFRTFPSRTWGLDDSGSLVFPQAIFMCPSLVQRTL